MSHRLVNGFGVPAVGLGRVRVVRALGWVGLGVSSGLLLDTYYILDHVIYIATSSYYSDLSQF